MRSQGLIDRIADIKSVVVFDEATHSYSVKGKPVPSVTTVMPSKGFFVSPERLEECRVEGEEKHSILEAVMYAIDMNIECEYTGSPFMNAVQRFIGMHPEFGEYVGSEVVLWSKFGYAGKADLLFENAVVDLKRTIGETKYHALQTTGYHRAAVEHDLIYSNKNHYMISIDDAGNLKQRNVFTASAETMFLICLKAFNEQDEAKKAGYYQLINNYLRSA